MIELLNEQVMKFNAKIKDDKKLQQDLEGIERSILIEITDGVSYYTILKDQKADELKEGTVKDPDIVISSDEATIRGLLNKEISPVKAFLVTKKLRIKASLEDKLRLRNFFS